LKKDQKAQYTLEDGCIKLNGDQKVTNIEKKKKKMDIALCAKSMKAFV